MYKENDKIVLPKKDTLQLNYFDNNYDKINGRYDNDDDNMSELLNTDEYSRQILATDLLDNSREKATETFISVMSNEVLSKMNHASDKVSLEEDNKNNIYIDFKESFSMKRVLNSKSSERKFKENAKEEREKYYFEHENKTHGDGSFLILNVSNIEDQKDTKYNGIQITEDNNSILYQIKKKNIKKVCNLDVFLKAPAETSIKSQDEKVRNLRTLSNITPENGKSNKLSSVGKKDDNSKSNPVKKPQIMQKPVNKIDKNTNMNVVKNKSKYSNNDHVIKSKDIVIESYSDRYKTKKVNTINDSENKDFYTKGNQKENSDRTHSEINRSVLGEIDYKVNPTSSFFNNDTKNSVISNKFKNTNRVSPVNFDTNKQFNSILSFIKSSFEECKTSSNSIVLKFKKNSSVVRNQKEKVIEVNCNFSEFLEEISNTNRNIENFNSNILELQENIKKYKIKEIAYIDEIEDYKYKTSLILAELKKSGYINENQANIDTIELNNNQLLYDTISNVPSNDCNFKGNSLPFSTSYQSILREIGIDTYVFYNKSMKSQEIVNDICEKCDDFKSIHDCWEGKWNYRKVFSLYPQIKLLLTSLASKFNLEVSSRLKSEEKSLKLLLNGMKNIENLDNKVKILERKNYSIVKNEHNKSSISSINSVIFHNVNKDELNI